jgi:hypothetical protein
LVKKILKYISTHSQLTLIVSIFLLILVNPFYWDKPFAEYFNFFFLTLILLSAVSTIKKSRPDFVSLRNAGFFLIAVSLLTALINNPYLDLLEQLTFIIFFILIAINLFLEMIKSKEVDSEVIFSAVAAYVLFGFCGALITAVIIFFQPLAFSLETTDISLFHQCLYFSFITITTTGYGDIVPLSSMAKTLAIFLSVFGQLYLTVIIGILIGKYLSCREKH